MPVVLDNDMWLDDAELAAQSHYEGATLTLAMSGSTSLDVNGSNTAPTFTPREGKLSTDLGSTSDAGMNVVVLSDGRILVAGQTRNGGNLDIALVRYNADGSLDMTFDGDGKLTTAVG